MLRNLRGDVLAVMAVVLLGGTIWALFYVDFPDGGKDVLLVVIGVLTTVVKDVYSFEFGSSKSGERNAQVVADMVPSPSSAIKSEDVKVEAAGDVTVNAGQKS